jgi:hypothetical protein
MRFLCALVIVTAAAAPPAIAADSGAAVAVAVRVSARTALHVSANVLEFTVPDGDTSATAVIDFTAAVRLPSSSGVVLDVDPSQVSGPGPVGDSDVQITFTGVGEGMKTGTLTRSTSAVAASWEGSGQRHGRIIFTIHAPAPGLYRVPVHLVLATP